MQKLPVSVSDFKKIRDENYYYIDKSLLIEEIINAPEVCFIPRPRRFGKSLNLSMLRYYFEKKPDGTDHQQLFEGLKILQKDGEHKKWAGQYPVISISFKDIKQEDWEVSYQKIQENIVQMYLDFKYLLDSPTLEEDHKKYFNKIINKNAEQGEYENSLKYLTYFLEKHHNKKIILLIDEYDTPIHAAYLNGYYKPAISFFRGFLSAALKENTSIAKGIVTGILRVSKESIFSGLSNVDVYTFLRPEFSNYFGLTDAEVNTLLKEYNASEHKKNVQSWYNGYIINHKTIYNPFSIICFLNSQDKVFRPYWLNTADNELIGKLLRKNELSLHVEVEDLLEGKNVRSEIEETISFQYLENFNKSRYVWSFLLFTGYLRCIKAEDEDALYSLNPIYNVSLPNAEIKIYFKNFVQNWLENNFKNETFEIMLKNLVGGNTSQFYEYFSNFVITSFSFHDMSPKNSEAVYHAFALGLFAYLSDIYEIKSNRESGLGRYDVCLLPKNRNKLGLIIEFKTISSENESPLATLTKAMAQIEEKKYSIELQAAGVKNILKLAIAFKGKEVFYRESRSHK